MKKRFILASSSPRRKKILKTFGIKFEVIPADIDEDKIDKKNPVKYVQEVARMKAEAVVKKIKEQNAVVVAADTVVLIDNHLLGKLHNKEQVRVVLRKLSGKSHKVLTGVAVIDIENNSILQDYEISKVKFKNLSEETIENYVKSMIWQNKAGGYNIEEIEEEFVDEIKGDYYNIVGLPLEKLKILLSKIGLSLKQLTDNKNQ